MQVLSSLSEACVASKWAVLLRHWAADHLLLTAAHTVHAITAVQLLQMFHVSDAYDEQAQDGGIIFGDFCATFAM